MPNDDERFAALEAALDAPPTLRARVSAWSTPRRQALLLAASTLVPLVITLTWLRVDWAVYPAPRLAAELLLLASLILLVGWRLLRPLFLPPLPLWVRPLLLLAALALLPLLALAPLAHQAHPASLDGTGARLLPAAAICLGLGLGWGLPAAGIAFLLDRAPGVSALALVLGGLTGTLALQLHCPMVAPGHLLLGHGSVVALGLILGLGLEHRSASPSM